MKKLLCLVLALLMLLSATACAIGDADTATTAGTDPATEAKQTEPSSSPATEGDSSPATDPTTDPTSDPTSAPTTEPSTEPEAETDGYEQPDLNGNGKDVHILYQKASGREDELCVEQLTNELVPDAVYTRNQLVETSLGIKMTYAYEEDSTALSSKLGNDIKGGALEFDLVTNATHVAVSAVLNGYYQNLTVLDNIDTSKYYWTQGYNSLATFTTENKQYLASGSLALSMFRLMFVTIFNREQMTSFGKDDLYEIVKKGEWTLDRQYEIITGMYNDPSGDGRTEDDFYGFITGNIISMDPYMVAADLHLIERDPTDQSLVFNADVTNALSALVDKVQKLVNDESTYVFETADKDDVGKDFIVETFAKGNSLMATIMFWNMEHSIETLSEINYGIVPIPKVTADQEYHSYVQDQVSSFGISAGVAKDEDKELLAAVLEALAYHSYQIVRPAYYTNTLSTRFMKDEESPVMLDLIFKSLQFDFSQSCSGMVSSPALRDSLRPILSGTSNTVASTIKTWSKSTNRKLRSINNQIAKLE